MRESWPMLGMAMIVLGLLNMITSALQIVLNVGNVFLEQASAQDLPQSEAMAQLLGTGFAVALMGFWIFCGFLWFSTGLMLRRRRGRGAAMFALALGLIPCCAANFLCTGFLNLAVSLYGLIVLSRRDDDGMDLY